MNTECKLMATEWWNGAIWTRRHAPGYKGKECGEGTPSAECSKYLAKRVIFMDMLWVKSCGVRNSAQEQT